jgi:hypothetical protein
MCDKKCFHPLIIVLTFFISAQLLTCFLSCRQTADLRKITHAPDSLMGDWQGLMVMADGSEQPLAAQVISYTGGKYRVNLLQGFDRRDSVLARLEAQRKEKVVHFIKPHDGTEWEGTIVGNSFKGHMTGRKTGQFNLSKVVRLSPSFDQPPPAGGIVLFAGTNLQQWQKVSDPVGYINLAQRLGGNDRVAYLRSYLWSDTNQQAIMLLGSDDGVKVWLNDHQVWVNNKNRGAEPADDTVQINLAKGWNTLLCKIANGDGGWGAYVKLVNQEGSALDNIYEKNPAADDSKSREALIKNSDYLTVWQVAGAYKQAAFTTKTTAAQLLEVVFPPEQQGGDWKDLKIPADADSARWIIKEGAMEVLPGSGSIVSRQKFNDFLLHVEFRSPFMPADTGQKRGNSGVYLQSRYEVQVLDSYGLEGADNECGGIYKVARPRVNMCAPPLQWQTYDVTFRTARFDAAGNKTKPAQITVIHNGVPIHENLILPAPTGGAFDQNENQPGGIMLQDHGDLVQYRNIWVVEEKSK